MRRNPITRFLKWVIEEGDRVLALMLLICGGAGTAALVKHVYCYIARGCGG